MVGQNPQHTYRKDGVFYYCRRVPKDLLFKYDETRIVMSFSLLNKVFVCETNRQLASSVMGLKFKQ